MNYRRLPSKDNIQKTMRELSVRNIKPHYLETKEETLPLVTSLIPDNEEVFTGASVTLDEIGFTELLASGQHGWKNMKDPIRAEKDWAKQTLMRRQATLANYFLCSAAAVTERGQIMIASGSGSQIAAIAYTSNKVIFIISTNKIVTTSEAGMKRISEYMLPLESERMKQLGFPGSVIGKVLIIEQELHHECFQSS